MSACSDWNRQTQQLQCWGAQNGCKRSLAYITSLQSTATKVCSQNGHKWKAMSESYVETCFMSSSHFLLFWGRRPKSIWGASSKTWTWGVNISTPIYVTCDNICRYIKILMSRIWDILSSENKNPARDTLFIYRFFSAHQFEYVT